ncbi:copper amine oxidase-like protein [Ureibacillus xyleni]|uniref:Copper amine oxidase-like protein n=1 Tax=Ureibacillus xyleni TaxID=614648 RepID=A0A285TDC3_9BACL|nr:stalk domain-containing protein [Ureibacillus xyleni]SOC19669.1 copper amine oxidase-like protein [Ureibacillus xyleni]
MKKTLSILLCSAIVGTIVSPVAGAEELNPLPVVDEKEEVRDANFYTIIGTISKITEESNGTFFATVKTAEEEFGFYFNDQTLVFDNTGKEVIIKEGMKFTAYVDSSKPMMMIYPPRYSPDVIIVHTEESGTVKLQQFDENLLNKEKDLIIHLSKETVMENLSRKPVTKEDIINKDVLIFYEVVLESYPAQAGPQKVILLERELSAIDKALKITETDVYEVNGETMIPLRLVAETLGFKVMSTGKGAIVSKGNVSFTITRGSKSYGYNKALKYFKESPQLLEEKKTYVPIEFLQLLIEHTEN